MNASEQRKTQRRCPFSIAAQQSSWFAASLAALTNTADIRRHKYNPPFTHRPQGRGHTYHLPAVATNPTASPALPSAAAVAMEGMRRREARSPAPEGKNDEAADKNGALRAGQKGRQRWRQPWLLGCAAAALAAFTLLLWAAARHAPTPGAQGCICHSR